MVEPVEMISCFQLGGLSHLPFVIFSRFLSNFYKNFVPIAFDSYFFHEIRARNSLPYIKFHKYLQTVCNILFVQSLFLLLRLDSVNSMPRLLRI